MDHFATRVLVVIVNYRTAQLVLDCLRSLRVLRNCAIGGLEIAVVDNRSGDDCLARVAEMLSEEKYPWPVRLVQARANGGFASGNNVVLAECAARIGAVEQLHPSQPDLIWLLNPDTYVSGTDLGVVLQWFRSHPRAGIVGNRLIGPDGAVQNSAFRRHSILSELDAALCMGPVSKLLRHHGVVVPISSAPAEVDWVSGASLFMRPEVIRKVGLLDDEYFMYFEEVDYCLAARRAGFEVWHLPAFNVVHLEGQASRIKSKSRRAAYWFASRARFFRNNYSAAYLHCANLLWITAYPLGRLWQWLRGKPSGDPARFWLDFIWRNYGPRGRVH